MSSGTYCVICRKYQRPESVKLPKHMGAGDWCLCPDPRWFDGTSKAEGDERHVFPIDGLSKEHTVSITCSCEPILERTTEFGIEIWAHNSMRPEPL